MQVDRKLSLEEQERAIRLEYWEERVRLLFMQSDAWKLREQRLAELQRRSRLVIVGGTDSE
jgi:hypothetical protein